METVALRWQSRQTTRTRVRGEPSATESDVIGPAQTGHVMPRRVRKASLISASCEGVNCARSVMALVSHESVFGGYGMTRVS